MATTLYDMFLALTLEGFTRKEAMQIIGTALSASFIAGGGQQDG